MSEREWGEMAMVVNAANEEKVARYVGSWGHIPESHWVFADGSTLLARQVSLVRPLAVIDPEDREAVGHFVDIYVSLMGKAGGPVNTMQAALRELAAPKPPRPEEPTGLGAVVEDEDGARWVRVGAQLDGVARPWAEHGNIADLRDWVRYADIAAVRILSPGVEVTQ